MVTTLPTCTENGYYLAYLYREWLLPTCTQNGYYLPVQRTITTYLHKEWLLPRCTKTGYDLSTYLQVKLGFEARCQENTRTVLTRWEDGFPTLLLQLLQTRMKVSTTYEIPVSRHDKDQHYKYKGTLSSFSNREHKTHAKRTQAMDSWRLGSSQPQRSYQGKAALQYNFKKKKIKHQEKTESSSPSFFLSIN